MRYSFRTKIDNAPFETMTCVRAIFHDLALFFTVSGSRWGARWWPRRHVPCVLLEGDIHVDERIGFQFR